MVTHRTAVLPPPKDAGRQSELEDLWIDGLVREQNAAADLRRGTYARLPLLLLGVTRGPTR